jgi:hypothetical protein
MASAATFRRQTKKTNDPLRNQFSLEKKAEEKKLVPSNPALIVQDEDAPSEEELMDLLNSVKKIISSSESNLETLIGKVRN